MSRTEFTAGSCQQATPCHLRTPRVRCGEASRDPVCDDRFGLTSVIDRVVAASAAPSHPQVVGVTALTRPARSAPVTSLPRPVAPGTDAGRTATGGRDHFTPTVGTVRVKVRPLGRREPDVKCARIRLMIGRSGAPQLTPSGAKFRCLVVARTPSLPT
jgi:hypothetical protein